eukprot:126108-Prorocentrum_minimum.AAC.1
MRLLWGAPWGTWAFLLGQSAGKCDPRARKRGAQRLQLRTDLAQNRGLGVVEDSHGEAQGVANGRIPYDDYEWDLKNAGLGTSASAD